MNKHRTPSWPHHLLSSALTLALLGCGGGGGTSAGGQSPGANTSQGSIIVDTVDTTPSWTPASAALIASFDAPASAVSSWTFSPGAEFPGANGSLSETDGNQATRAASLNYNLGCSTTTYSALNTNCGRYVAANFTLSSPMSVGINDQPTLSLDLRNVQGTAKPSLRIVDGSGQTLQFPIQLRTIEQAGAMGWRSVQIPIARSTNFWGGDNNGIFRGPLRAVSVLVGDHPMSYPQGSLDIDNVVLLPTSHNTFELKANAPLSDIAFPSSYVGRVGVSVQSYTPAALDKLKAAGITLIRKDLRWDGVEINGQFSFAPYDALSTALAQRNMSVLWILDYGHPDHGGAAPLTPTDQAAYAEFARRAAQRYKNDNVAGYEIWNEPNMDKRWPSPNASSYAQLLSTAAASIHLENPQALVISGGLANTDTTYLLNMLNTGLLANLDAVGIHPYRKTNPETFAAEITPLTQLLASKGTATALWDTEWGYSSYGDFDTATYGDGHDPRALNRQGQLVLRKVLTQIALNTPVSIIYNLFDDANNPTERENNFGLLNTDGSDKPSMLGLKQLYAAQAGRIFKGFLPDVPPTLHVLRWDGDTDRAFALWCDNNDRTLTIKLPVQLEKITRWDGQVIQATSTDSGPTITLREADGPVFITLRK